MDRWIDGFNMSSHCQSEDGVGSTISRGPKSLRLLSRGVVAPEGQTHNNTHWPSLTVNLHLHIWAEAHRPDRSLQADCLETSSLITPTCCRLPGRQTQGSGQTDSGSRTDRLRVQDRQTQGSGQTDGQLHLAVTCFLLVEASPLYRI